MKKIALLLAILLTLTLVAACADTTPAPIPEATPAATPTPAPEPTPTPEPEPLDPQEEDSDVVSVSSFDVSIAAIRGPTALGLFEMMDRNERGETINNYELQLLGSPDEIPPLLVRGEVDVAAVPGNLASVLYNRLDGDVVALAVVTLGVLHVVDMTDTIHSIADLEGRTIYVIGQGATPEFALNYVLTQNGLTPGVDVTVQFVTEPPELAALLEAGQAEIALMPEPFMSGALMQIDGLRHALDLTEEWNRVQPEYGLIMSVVVARREFVENYPEAVATLLEEYAQSIAFMTTNIPDAAQLAVDFGLIPNAAIAEAAIPRTHIVFITGDVMRQNLLGFYSVLYNENPDSIGGEMPEEDFFFIP